MKICLCDHYLEHSVTEHFYYYTFHLHLSSQPIMWQQWTTWNHADTGVRGEQLEAWALEYKVGFEVIKVTSGLSLNLQSYNGSFTRYQGKSPCCSPKLLQSKLTLDCKQPSNCPIRTLEKQSQGPDECKRLYIPMIKMIITFI